MVCPNCKTVNESGHVFCVNCGVNFANQSQSNQQDSTGFVNNPTPDTGQQQNYGTSDSTETIFAQNPNSQSIPNFNPTNPNTGHNYPPTKRNWLPLLAIPLLLLIGLGVGAFYLMNQEPATTEVLPKDYGFYFYNDDNTKLKDLVKIKSSNALETKEELIKDNDLPELKSKTILVLFAENEDVPLNDLRLVEIDSIKDDGTFREIEFQKAPIEGKSDMRKLRVKDGLATGKYAFAVFEDYLNEGNHKFWAFEVKTGVKSDNGDLVSEGKIPIKKEEKPQVIKVQEVPAPPGARVSYVTSNRVVMRSGPSQASGKIGKFSRGQKVYVIGQSSHQEVFRDKYDYYYQVQTTSGRKGWIYGAYLR